MLDFIKSAYRVFVLIGFWVFLIGCTIGGGVIGNFMGRSYDRWTGRSSGHPILGGFIGLIAGFIIDILIFGFIATILNMDENLEQLKYNSRNTSSSLASGNISPIVRRLEDIKKCKRCGKSIDGGYTACPHCGGDDFE